MTVKFDLKDIMQDINAACDATYENAMYYTGNEYVSWLSAEIERSRLFIHANRCETADEFREFLNSTRKNTDQ